MAEISNEGPKENPFKWLDDEAKAGFCLPARTSDNKKTRFFETTPDKSHFLPKFWWKYVPGISQKCAPDPASQDLPDMGDYISMIKNGIPEVNGRGKKVVIIGAGFAGLTAGRELKRAGYNVEILEASSRAGGRVFTIRNFSDDLYGEAGAMRIPPVHYLTHAYAQLLGVPMSKFQNNDPNGRNYYSTKSPSPVRKADWSTSKQLEYLCSELNITVEEALSLNERLTKVLTEKILNLIHQSDDPAAAWEKIVKEYDHYSLRDFLQEEAKWKPGEINYYAQTASVETFMEAGVLEIIRESVGQWWNDESTFKDPFYPSDPKKEIVGLMEFKHGMDSFAKAMLHGERKLEIPEVPPTINLRDNVRYGHRVTKIYSQPQDNGNHRLQVDCETLTREIKSVYADFLIVTAPFSVVRNIVVTPPFSLKKQEAIRELGYTTSCKIFLQYSHRFWEDGLYPISEFGGCSSTDLPVRQIYYPPASHNQDTFRGVLLASYTWNNDAMNWGSLYEEDRVKLAVDNIELIHPGSKKYFENGQSWVWHEPHREVVTGGGSFAWFPPTQWTRLFDGIAKPENNRIFFAGEHASYAHGWIHGAMLSALDAVEALTYADWANGNQSWGTKQ